MARMHRILAMVACVVSALVLGSTLHVSAESQVLDPGVSFEVTMRAKTMAFINYSWSVDVANASVKFVVLQPDGSVVANMTASSYEGFLLTIISGDYRFIWNSSEPGPINLDYAIVFQSTGFESSDHILDTVLLGLLVGAVVVVIIIVLVIVVVVRGGRRTQTPMIGHPSELSQRGEFPSPHIPGMCPRCGSPIDSQHAYCPKCGHRVR